MRLAKLVGAAVLLVAGSVSAAPGDPLIVTGDGVNVRAGPSTGEQILLRVYRRQEVVELGREGEWVRVEIAGTAGQQGWIHGSLLTSPERPPATGRAAAPETTDALSEGGMEAGETAMVPGTGASPARGADLAGVSPAAGPVVAGPEVERFKESVSYLNNRAMQVAGVDLFTEVEAVDEAMVEVGITDAWTTVPPAGQRSYLNTLLDRWAAAKGGAGPVSIRIVDADGQVLAEETRP